MAPMDAHYLWRNDTEEANPGLIVWNSSITTQSTLPSLFPPPVDCIGADAALMRRHLEGLHLAGVGVA